MPALTAGQLDAAILGEAASMVVQDSATWARWGDQDRVLQLVKYLWHILVASGRPA